VDNNKKIGTLLGAIKDKQYAGMRALYEATLGQQPVLYYRTEGKTPFPFYGKASIF